MKKKKIEGLLLGESAPRRPGMSGILLREEEIKAQGVRQILGGFLGQARNLEHTFENWRDDAERLPEGFPYKEKFARIFDNFADHALSLCETIEDGLRELDDTSATSVTNKFAHKLVGLFRVMQQAAAGLEQFGKEHLGRPIRLPDGMHQSEFAGQITAMAHKVDAAGKQVHAMLVRTKSEFERLEARIDAKILGDWFGEARYGMTHLTYDQYRRSKGY